MFEDGGEGPSVAQCPKLPAYLRGDMVRDEWRISPTSSCWVDVSLYLGWFGVMLSAHQTTGTDAGPCLCSHVLKPPLRADGLSF